MLVEEPSHSEHDLRHQLLTQPRRFDYRYTHAAECELRQLLFRSLARGRQDYLQYFFPQGPPVDQSEVWSLRAAQGAVDGAEYLPSAKGTACGHIFKSGESTYSCKTCQADDTCVLCSRCFESSDHEGHQVYVQVSPGNSGCCDCGDSEAWRREVKCSIHTEGTEDARPSGKNKAPVKSSSSELPQDLVESVRETIAQAADYLCDVFSCSPEQLRLVKTPESVKADERLSRLSSAVYSTDVEEDEDIEYALLLWNDEKHTVVDVQNQVAKACRQTKTFGLQKAYEVNDNGRAIVNFSKNINEVVNQAKILEQIKITVTIRSSRDTFREQMCETIIDWMGDIAGCATGQDVHLLRNAVCEELLNPWRMGSSASNKNIGQEGIDDHEYEDTEKARRRYATLFRPGTAGGAIIRVDIEPDAGDDDEDGDDGIDFEEEDEDEEMGVDEDDMDVEIDDVRQDVIAANMDVDFAEDGDDVTEAMEAALAGYPPPPPPPPPTAGQRRRILTPAESDDGEVEQARPVNAPFAIPQTPKQRVVIKRPSKPSRHWLEKPDAYKGPRPSEPQEDLWQRVRMDWLILYDLRLWKTLRIKLRHMYITNVATIPQFKRVLGLRFAGLYTPLAELYLVADREPDHSIINLSVQMLTTPSITEEVVERGNFLTNLMAIVYTFLTTRQVGFPEDVQPLATLAFDTGSVTNRRLFHFFSDMRWLFNSEFIQEQLRVEPRYLLQFVDLVKLHQGLCPNVRAIGEHVEYESDTWISASLIIKEIDRLCKAVAMSFDTRSPEDDVHLQRAIRTVGQVTMINSFGYERKRFHTHELRDDMAWHETGPFNETGKTYSVPRFAVQSEPMSFHHPLHYLLSWLIDLGRGYNRDIVRSLLHFSPEDLKDPYNYNRGPSAPKTLTSDELLCGIFDHPLRLCVWLSQMKAGLWVRNGITLRHQGHTYRSVSHRDVAYQRDLFMIQAGFVLCGATDERPTERFLAQMMNRFQVDTWIKASFQTLPQFEDSQQMDMLEDFYHLVAVALSERGNLALGSGEHDQADKILQHDIAHALCFKPLSFSDLNSRVTEKIADSESFDRVLEEMTDYRAPEGLNDTGTFKLKPEYIELVNPYYPHYSRNQREEAENVYKKHKASVTGKQPKEIVFEPRLQSLDGTLFEALPSLTRTPLFATIIAAALQYANNAKSISPNVQPARIESFLHVVLHLIVVALLEDEHTSGDNFADWALALQHRFPDSISWTIVQLLVALYQNTDYASCHAATRYALQKILSRRPEASIAAMGAFAEELQAGVSGRPSGASAEEKEKKKQDAKERQARVMAQMKQQQNSFLMNKGMSGFEDEDYDELDDETLDEPEAMEAEGKTWGFPSGTCILCQEETNDQRLYGTFSYLGESNILRSTPVDDPDFVQEILEIPENLDQSANDIRPFGVAGKNKQVVQKTTGDGKMARIERQGLSKGFEQSEHSTRGPVSTSCGHIMHYSCFELYFSATQRRHAAQIARSQPETLGLKEFICPLCKALGNAFMPIVWKAKDCAPEHALHAAQDFEDWLQGSAQSYTPNLDWLHNQGALAQYHQQAQDIHSQRSQEYVNKTYVPSLADALRDRPLPTEQPRYSFRRGLSLSSIFPGLDNGSGVSHRSTPSSGSEPMPRLAELVKAYHRIDETVRANRLCSPGKIDDGTVNPVSSLSRALGFTISALEIQHRGNPHNSTSSSLLEDLSEQHLTHLRILSETIESYLAVNVLRGAHGNAVARETALRREVIVAQLFGTEHDVPMINVRDFAGNLLFEDDAFLFYADWIAFMVPNVAEASSILQLCFWAEIVKVVYVYRGLLRSGTVPVPDEVGLMDIGISDGFERAVQGLAALDTRDPYSRIQLSNSQLKVLRRLLDKYALTFLRKSILLLHVRHGLDFECPFDLDPATPEIERLTKLLHIPSIDSLCSTYASDRPGPMLLQTLTRRWVSQASGILEHPRTRIPIKLSHPAIFELVGLPKNYDILTEEAIKRKCPTTGKEITDPAICLFCAAIFCSQATCCMKGPENSSRGGCWQHMQKCGGRIGIFINIRKCMVLFLHEPLSGSFAHAPYLDRHGEPDPTLRRHHVLYLNQKRYDKLIRDVWLGHGVQTFISRKLEAEMNPGGFETL